MAGVQAQYDAIQAQMQADIDAHAQAPGAAGGPLLPLPGMPQQIPMPDLAAMMQAMMQQFMQAMMDHMQQAFTQTVPGAQNAGPASAAFCPQEACRWR